MGRFFRFNARTAWTALIAGLLQAIATEGCGGSNRSFGSQGGAGAAGTMSDGGMSGRSLGGSPPAGDGGAGAAGMAEGGSAGELGAGGSGGEAGDENEAGAAGATAGAGGSSASAGAGGQVATLCGNGTKDAGEECDLGSKNSVTAYGVGQCTNTCKNAPFCGDAKVNGAEVCEPGATQDLGSCNAECSGFYEKKYIRPTSNVYAAGGLGGIAGADAKCALEFGTGWKALLVGGGRRATTTPLLGDNAQDWVIHKYTHYYSYVTGTLLWRTDALPLLGVRNGARVNVYADAFPATGNYPWSGWKSDWTTFPDTTDYQGTCAGWTSTSAGWASFAFADLTQAASESCATSSFILCVEQ